MSKAVVYLFLFDKTDIKYQKAEKKNCCDRKNKKRKGTYDVFYQAKKIINQEFPFKKLLPKFE